MHQHNVYCLLIPLAAGAVALVAAVVFAAASIRIARAHADRRHRYRALAGRPVLEFTRRARLPVVRCSACGFAFIANSALTRPSSALRHCPNPRCRMPWLWSWPSDDQVHHEPDDEGGTRGDA